MDPHEVATEIAARFTGAWNRHDMDEFGRLFRDDASFVNVIGIRMQGRDEIQQMHANIHATHYRDSHLLFEVNDARELAPGVIVAGVRSQLSGDERAPGEVRDSLITLVADRRGDEWGIAAAQNTLVMPPR
jgi:uncharacterized protein (TIGR02246 family)